MIAVKPHKLNKGTAGLCPAPAQEPFWKKVLENLQKPLTIGIWKRGWG
jgi:hypothetical protein